MNLDPTIYIIVAAICALTSVATAIVTVRAETNLRKNLTPLAAQKIAEQKIAARKLALDLAATREGRGVDYQTLASIVDTAFESTSKQLQDMPPESSGLPSSTGDSKISFTVVDAFAAVRNILTSK